jgi:hypothetical protein
LALSKMIFSFDDRKRYVHEVVVEISLTWHRNEQRHLGYWIDLYDS